MCPLVREVMCFILKPEEGTYEDPKSFGPIYLDQPSTKTKKTKCLIYHRNIWCLIFDDGIPEENKTKMITALKDKKNH